MRTLTGRRLRQWLLFCVVAFALVGMHHMPTAPCGPPVETAAHATEQPEPQHCPPQDGAHDLLHLCLMVLGFVAGIALVWLLLAASGVLGAFVSRVQVTGRWRPPRLSGRSLLTSVCVSRT